MHYSSALFLRPPQCGVMLWGMAIRMNVTYDEGSCMQLIIQIAF